VQIGQLLRRHQLRVRRIMSPARQQSTLGCLTWANTGRHDHGYPDLGTYLARSWLRCRPVSGAGRQPGSGSRRTRTRLSPRTTTAPAARSSATGTRLAWMIANWSAARRPESCRISRIDGLVARERASRLPKSVSAEMSTRSSVRARSRTTLSVAAWRPTSRTCSASCRPP
jgi:hypothetical protein